MGQAFRDIGTLVTLSYQDARRLTRAMWQQIGLMVVMMFMTAIPGALLNSVVHTALGREVVGTLATVAGLRLTAPYSVAVYRFILTGAVLAPETLRKTPASQHFFAWSAVIAFIVSLPSYAYAILGAGWPAFTGTGTGPVNVPQTLVTFALLLAVWVFATRVLTLLPAVAMERSVTLKRALAESRGHFWFIIGASVATVLPLTLFSAILQAVVSIALGKPAGGFVALLIAVATVLVVIQLGLSLSARLYQRFAPEVASSDADRLDP